MRAEGWNVNTKPTASNMTALELCISDQNKPLLLNEPTFIAYLVDALLLDPQHPRQKLKHELKVWLQTMHAECINQLALFGPGREALLADASVAAALEAVAKSGLCEQSREFAAAALLALSDKELVMDTEGENHVMLSYQWDMQSTIKRVDASLQRRGYLTWFDLTNSAS